jgi:hypothetical protein
MYPTGNPPQNLSSTVQYILVFAYESLCQLSGSVDLGHDQLLLAELSWGTIV